MTVQVSMAFSTLFVLRTEAGKTNYFIYFNPYINGYF